MKKEIQELLKKQSALKTHDFFIIDTEKVLYEAVKNNVQIEQFFHCGKGYEFAEKYGIEMPVKVKKCYIDRYSKVKTHQNFIALGKTGGMKIIDYSGIKKAVLFDRVQDPSNVGAIIRSGIAYGFNDYFFIDSVYPFSEKTIRASAGNVFKIKYREIKKEEIAVLKDNFKIITADSSEGRDAAHVKIKGRFILVFGSEGQGISKEIDGIKDFSIKIDYPNKQVESLNVAASAAIIFNLLCR